MLAVARALTHPRRRRRHAKVRSFGVGGHVRLPGRTAESPNVYDFGTPYAAIKADLEAQDAALYARNGLLPMVERNAAVKRAPEKWQACRDAFDVVLCFEERVLEQVVDDLAARHATLQQPVLVVNIDVRDSADEAARVGPQALDLCKQVVCE